MEGRLMCGREMDVLQNSKLYLSVVNHVGFLIFSYGNVYKFDLEVLAGFSKGWMNGNRSHLGKEIRSGYDSIKGVAQ